MKKKGDLTDSVLGIIVAGVCLILLGYLIYLVYGIASASEYKNAQKVIDIIEAKIKLIDDGSSMSFVVQSPCKKNGLDECKWNIFGWGRDDEKRPDRCYFKSCICICQGSGESDAKEKCQDTKTGICRLLDFDEILVNESTYQDNKASSEKYIFFSKALQELKITKDGKNLEIYHKDEAIGNFNPGDPAGG